MAHNLTEIALADGTTRTAFIYNRQSTGVPWHGLGTPHDGPFMIPKAVRTINADFKAQSYPIFRKDGTPIDGYQEIAHPGGLTYQIATAGYEIVNYSDLAQAFAIAAGEDKDNPRGNTMGMIGHNAGRFFVSSADEGMKIDKNNEYLSFLVFDTGHALRANRVFKTRINPVCQNTLDAGLKLAERQKDGFVLLPHKTGVNERISQISYMIAMARKIDKTAIESYLAMSKRLVTAKEVDHYVTRLFPWEGAPGETPPERAAAKRLDVASAFAYPVMNDRATGSDGRSALGLLNAATFWIDNSQAKGDWTRTAFSPACQKSRQVAFDTALELAGTSQGKWN